MQKDHSEILSECRKRIEEQLQWGDSSHWSGKDFEVLSEKIRETTGIYLSASTLKRLWAKVKYDSDPSTTTLDTLAQFLHYKNWRDFKKQYEYKDREIFSNTRSKRALASITDKTKKGRYYIIFLAVLCLLSTCVILFLNKPKQENIVKEKFLFNSKKTICSGVPNTVIFNYDASSSPFDSIYIQQSWDPARRERVSVKDHQYTSIYYYPGYFKAKLLAGEKVVGEHDLLIETSGWLPIIEKAPVPIYLPAFSDKSQELYFSPQEINNRNIDWRNEETWMKFSKVGGWGNIQTNQFTFKASLKSDCAGYNSCEQMEVLLLGENCAIIIPLSQKGCVSNANLLYLDQYISGKNNDLSAFGANLNNWTDLKCEANNNSVNFYINDQLVYKLISKRKPAKIIGIEFRFKGLGRVKNISLK